MQDASIHLPDGYSLRLMSERDYAEISAICAAVYPTETPYSRDELAAHHAVFPEGQFIVIHDASGAVAGTHFTLMLRMLDFHLDDSWEVLTARGTFSDHDPLGHTLYGADLMVHPAHQHHGIGRALHEAPQVPCTVYRSYLECGDFTLRPGMVLAIEPMLVLEPVRHNTFGELVGPRVALAADGWTVMVASGAPSCHVEHTVAVNRDGAEVLTRFVPSNSYTTTKQSPSLCNVS